ncbi:class C sortase [Schaalia sp. 19OD2882]|uniref:class C sortase n=1 Tax=Schaalia sp. 19OD2882 TaxID=2794089 RepID=UPI001C1EF44D|nr:class C sortase [Schaalia sp. 19OD2882]QWW19265.1 class C sortase [Schaalia sp. 19OD2882]
MARSTTRQGAAHGARPRWRLNRLSLLPALLALLGILALSYPTVAAWLTQYNQSKVVTAYEQQVAHTDPDARTQLSEARQYNEALSVGALLEANTNVPTGQGSSGSVLDYRKILTANADGLMGRVRIPVIDVDLPIYHGTDERSLLKGVGHLEGTSLPVGGADRRTVLTAHRGLADARMFTDLDKVKIGDSFTVEVFGEVLTYRVRDAKVVQPEETESLRVEPGKDLATLVTCTPLGINSHRILLTGERVVPTPAADVAKAGSPPEVPGFPWWIFWILGALVLVGVYVWWSGLPVKPRKAKAAPQE